MGPSAPPVRAKSFTDVPWSDTTLVQQCFTDMPRSDASQDDTMPLVQGSFPWSDEHITVLALPLVQYCFTIPWSDEYITVTGKGDTLPLVQYSFT